MIYDKSLGCSHCDHQNAYSPSSFVTDKTDPLALPFRVRFAVLSAPWQLVVAGLPGVAGWGCPPLG
jgi:hypothetical protein